MQAPSSLGRLSVDRNALETQALNFRPWKDLSGYLGNLFIFCEKQPRA